MGAGPVGPLGAGPGRGGEEDQDSLSATPSCRLVWLCMMHTAAVCPSVSSAQAYNDGMHWRCALATYWRRALTACTDGKRSSTHYRRTTDDGGEQCQAQHLQSSNPTEQPMSL